MANKVTCYVKLKNGRYKKCKSIDGANFKGPGGITYDAPIAANHEILDLNHWLLGRRMSAFYREGAKTPIPLDKKGIWREVANSDDDKEFLAGTIKKALWDSGIYDTKLNAQLGATGLLIVLLLVHWIW